MYEKNLVIINNEKILKEENNFFCENIDIKSIIEDLDKKFNVIFIARKVKELGNKRKINFSYISVASNIFLFLLNIFKTFKKEKTIYLIISITPYTFLSCIFLFLFKKKIFIYLRSNGYEEYKAIFGFIGPIIYNVMFKIVTFKTNVITCQKRLFTKGKSDVVFPSEINSFWIDNKQAPLLDMPRLLYVGRVKVEKGIFSLLKIFDQIKIDSKLSIIGRVENVNSNNKRVSFVGPVYGSTALIKIYDNHNIFILPSFTEAHP